MKGFDIGEALEYTLKSRFKKGSTLLELGSGEGTERLSTHFRMISIEDNPLFLNLYNSEYYHVNIDPRTHWYNRHEMTFVLGLKYDLILIDAPRAIPADARKGFLHNMDLFNCEIPIFVDDTHRQPELELAFEIATKLKRGMEIINDGEKQFVIV